MNFIGSMTALITPFQHGKVDEQRLRSLIHWQLENGIHALVMCGTTGEAATLTEKEREAIARIAVHETAGRIPVIVGTGTNNTLHTIELAKQAKACGAHAHLCVTPYYNKPTQEGLYQHFQAIASAVDLPMILYNVPGRTGVNMLPETVARLSHLDHIIGIKEASGNIAQVKDIITQTPTSFLTLSGEDNMNVDIYKLGGRGCISVTSNVVPDRVASIWNLFQQGELEEATLKHEALLPLNRTLFLETSPIPVKTALAMMGRCAEEFRLPMTPMHETTRTTLQHILKDYHLLS